MLEHLVPSPRPSQPLFETFKQVCREKKNIGLNKYSHSSLSPCQSSGMLTRSNVKWSKNSVLVKPCMMHDVSKILSLCVTFQFLFCHVSVSIALTCHHLACQWLVVMLLYDYSFLGSI